MKVSESELVCFVRTMTKGINKVSECCDAKIIYTDICSECMQHCGVCEDE